MMTYTQPAPNGYQLIVVRPSREVNDDTQRRSIPNVLVRLRIESFVFNGQEEIIDALAGDGSHLRDYQHAGVVQLDGRIVDLKLKRTFSSESSWLKATTSSKHNEHNHPTSTTRN